MSIPAARIKQIRAMFAKAQYQMAKTYGRKRVGSPYWAANPQHRKRFGVQNFSSWVEAKPNMVRKIRDYRAGKPVPVLQAPMRRSFRITKEDAERTINKPYPYGSGQKDDKHFAPIAIKIDTHYQHYLQRESRRKFHRWLRKGQQQ